jgi:hypothetical protein
MSVGGVGCAVLLLERILFGSAPHIHTLAEVLAINLEPRNLVLAAINFAICCGPLVVLAAFGWSRASRDIRCLLFPVPFYAAALIVWAVWAEVRVWTSMFPLVLPCALAGLFRSQRTILR